MRGRTWGKLWVAFLIGTLPILLFNFFLFLFFLGSSSYDD